MCMLCSYEAFEQKYLHFISSTDCSLRNTMCFVFHLKRTSHKRTSHKNVFLNQTRRSMASLPHQWILCSEWVPSEWDSKQLIKTLNHFDPYNIFLAIATNIPQRLKTGPASHLLKLKCKYSNILRYCFFSFISCKLLSSKLKQKNFWSFYFTCNESKI